MLPVRRASARLLRGCPLTASTQPAATQGLLHPARRDPQHDPVQGREDPTGTLGLIDKPMDIAVCATSEARAKG